MLQLWAIYRENNMMHRAATAVALLIGVSTAAIAQSPPSTNAAPPPPPPASAVQPAVPAADMQAVLDAHKALGAKPIETLTPVKARLQPSAADATMAVMRKQGMSVAPDPAVVTTEMPYGTNPMQYARIYRPAAAGNGGASLPVVVYFHGGGWVIADVNTYDATPRLLSKQLNAIVVSVEYRHAPEAKFPAQHDDASAAYQWVLQNAASWGGDVKKIALAGESAGGNLAVATAIYARDNHLPGPVHILAVYPIANSDKMLPSRKDSANAKPLNTAMLKWFGYFYAKDAADQMDPRINLVKADLRDLPPTTIINAQIDPLRSDGETLASAMRAAGDRVDQRTFAGVTHEFFGMGKVVRGAYDAENYAIAKLKSAFFK